MVDINHNISAYDFVKVEDVKFGEDNNELIFYDIEVEDEHTFHIKFGDQYVLSHNCDGQHILGLVINMLNEFWPELLSMGFIHRLNTPLVIANNDKEFFSLDDYNRYKETHKIKTSKYFKGLGSFTAKEFKKFLSDKKYIKTITVEDTEDIGALDIAFDKSKADERKIWLIS